METLQVETSTKVDLPKGKVPTKDRTDELTLIMNSENVQESSMSEIQKQEKRAVAPSLQTLFEQTVQEKGEAGQLEKSWLSHSELEVNGLSKMTLHSFVMEAEKLGKKITFTRTLQVKISD